MGLIHKSKVTLSVFQLIFIIVIFLRNIVPLYKKFYLMWVQCKLRGYSDNLICVFLET